MVQVELTAEEADWLITCLGMVMKLARHWDDRTDNDIANRTLSKLAMASVNPLFWEEQ